jgi:hypothetical protein
MLNKYSTIARWEESAAIDMQSLGSDFIIGGLFQGGISGQTPGLA